MAQLTYTYFTPVASAGLKADLCYDYVISCRAFVDIHMGLGVAKVTGVDFQVRLPTQNLTTLVFSADLVASNVINGEVNGIAITPVTYTSSHLNTMGLIAAAIETADDQLTATVGGANNRTITIQANNGFNATAANWIVTLGASQATITITNTNNDVFYGISLRQKNKQNVYTPLGSGGPTPYFIGDSVPVETNGVVWVQPETAVSSDGPVYWRFVDGGLGKAIGQFRNDSDAGTAILIPSSIARWLTSSSGNGNYAQLQIKLP